MLADRRKLLRQVLRGEAHSRATTATPYCADGLLGILGDDILVTIMELLATLDADAEGAEWHAQKRDTTRDTVNFSRTCWRVRNALVADRPSCGPLHAELVARGLTNVRPLVTSAPRPHTEQLRREEHSQYQLRAMGYIDEEVGFHCAGKCCEPAREEANRRMRKHKGNQMHVTSVGSRMDEISPARDDPGVAYGYDRGRHMTKMRGSQVTHTLRCTGSYDGTYVSGVLPLPLMLRASPDGKHLAWTAWDPLGCVQLSTWSPQATLAEASQHGEEGVVLPVDFGLGREGEGMGVLPGRHPTTFWWTSDNLLRVAWTATYVSPSGVDSEEGELPSADDCYEIATYSIDADDGQCALVEIGPVSGPGERLINVSPDESGMRLACLVRVCPRRKPTSHYKVVIHVNDMREELLHPQVWKGQGHGKGGFDWGPSAAGMSPAGDCVVVVHRTAGSCISEVFDHDAGARYVRVNAHNISDWMRLDQEDKGTGSNSVKLRYAVGWSGCGRFATVLDQRARWKYYMQGYALIALDLSQRRWRCEIPVRGLCHCEDADFDFGQAAGLRQDTIAPTPMRELHWGRESIWALARRGALVIAG